MTESAPSAYAGPPEPPVLLKNKAAIVALCLGLASCVPFLGVAAVGFGVVGLQRAGDPRYQPGTRPLAAFGVVLGVIGLFWSIMLASAAGQYFTMRKAMPAVAAQKEFLLALGTGDVGRARGFCAEAIDETKLTQAFEKFQSYGPLIDKPNEYYGGEIHSDADVEVQTGLPYADQIRIFIGHWTVEGSAPRLTRFDFTDGPTTQPTTRPAAT